MSKVQPFQIACAFRAAVPYLLRSHEYERRHSATMHEYICHALEEAALQNRISVETQVAATSVILERMHPYSALDCWAHMKGLLQGAGRWEENFPDMQAYRHRWLEALAQEFIAKSPSIGGLGIGRVTHRIE